VAQTIESPDGTPVSTLLSTHDLICSHVVDWLAREAGIHVATVDADASLFELGVDSLGAASIAAALETATNKTLNPRSGLRAGNHQ